VAFFKASLSRFLDDFRDVFFSHAVRFETFLALARQSGQIVQDALSGRKPDFLEDYQTVAFLDGKQGPFLDV